MKKNSNVVFMLVSFLTLLLLVTACSSDDSEKIKNASIKQVLSTEIFQNNGHYLLENGTLTIYKKIQPRENIEESSGKTELTDEEKNSLNKYLKNDFPDEQIEYADELFQDFTREVKDSYIVIDEEAQKTTLYGKDYENEFSWVNQDGTRIKDANAVEYSFEK